jgi:hypothetical protein
LAGCWALPTAAWKAEHSVAQLAALMAGRKAAWSVDRLVVCLADSMVVRKVGGRAGCSVDL